MFDGKVKNTAECTGVIGQGAAYGYASHLFISPLFVVAHSVNGDIGQHELAKIRDQVVVRGPDVVTVGLTADALLYLPLQGFVALTGDHVKAFGPLWQALVFAESGSVIDFTGHTLGPVQLTLASCHTVPPAIKQLVANLPDAAARSQVQDHFPVTQVVGGVKSSGEPQSGQCWRDRCKGLLSPTV